MPKVSVIVPFYNVEKYIRNCLESLANQTLKEIDILLVDDGSKDGSTQVAQEFVEKYPGKFTYLKKENGGLSDARNYAIPYTKGEYIAFLDSDDYVELDTYEKMYELAKKEKSDLVECDFYWEFPNHKKENKANRYQNQKEMLQKIRVVAWNKLIRKEILENTKIKFPKGYQYEDVEFTYQLIPYLKKVSYLEKACIHYIQREGSIAKSQNERTKEIFDVLDHVILFYQKNGFYEQYEEVLEYLYARYVFCSSILRMGQIKKKEIRKKILKQAWEKVNRQFPNWKKNAILKKEKGKNNLYLKTINTFTYPIYCKVFSIKSIASGIEKLLRTV